MARESGLERLKITPEDAINLPRGVRRSVAGYLTRFGFNEEARDLLRHIIAQSPGSMLYRRWLITALTGCGEIEEAERLSEELESDYPNNTYALTCRAQIMFANKNNDAACETLAKFILDPRESHAYWGRLALACQQRGSWNRAQTALDRALAIFESKPTEEDKQLIIPIYLLLALAAQDEHNGIEKSLYREELEARMREEEEKLQEQLEAWKNEGIRSPKSKKKLKVNPEPTANAIRVIDPEVVAAMRTADEDPVPNSVLEGQLNKFFGFNQFRKGQQQVIERVLAGDSVLAVMPTGAGKSLCYQLPAMLLDGVTLVVSPLIALMKDQVDSLPADVQKQVTLINSTLEGDEIDRRLREVRAGKYKLVYAAPERLRQRPFMHALRSRGVSLLVIDEAHCVSLWGHDFRPDYLAIGDALAYLGHPTVLAMTATATPRMRLEISNHLGRQFHIVSTGTHRPNLFLESVLIRNDEEKMRELVRLCMENDGTGIVYTRSRKKAEDLAKLLNRERIRSTFYHAGMDSEQRARTHEEFMDGRWRVICATVAFGMGIDKSDVRFVIHYSLPASLEDYYQEAGRAGRDGFPSRCILMATPGDKARNTRWMGEEWVNLDLPKACYQLIREMTHESRFAAIHPDDLRRDLKQDDTRIRVAISMLEDVGLVRRHPDAPITFTIGLTEKGVREGGQELSEFAGKARLRVGQRVPLETVELCRRTGLNPNEVEEKLLNWQSLGYVTFYGSGRVLLIERLPATKDSRASMENLLTKYSQAQEMRLEEIFKYAETHRCRHDVIAEHFGEPPIENCMACDNCNPQPDIREAISKQAAPIDGKISDDEKCRKIIETVEMIKGRVGFTGLIKVLKGSITSYIKRDTCPNFGIFANLPKATIERLVQELLDDGLLTRDDSEYRLIWPGNQD
ncbi:MAG: RecQ family ATP-dependent DNA helicase [Armatimonadota bacterium]|nr:RecQ family ATP-dependent DNA helicase [bacterium]